MESLQSLPNSVGTSTHHTRTNMDPVYVRCIRNNHLRREKDSNLIPLFKVATIILSPSAIGNSHLKTDQGPTNETFHCENTSFNIVIYTNPNGAAVIDEL